MSIETSPHRAGRTPPARRFEYVAAAFAALGGLLFGYDTGVISGAELFLKNDFTLSTFVLEVIVSGVLAGAAAGALLGGRLADLFGRRKLLIVTAIIFAAGAVVCAAATSPAMLARDRCGGELDWLRVRCRSTSRKSHRRTLEAGRFHFFNWQSLWAFFSPMWRTTRWRRFRDGAGCSVWRWCPPPSLDWAWWRARAGTPGAAIVHKPAPC